MFSEEFRQSTLQQFVVGKKYVPRFPGKRFDNKYAISTIKQPSRQMIWGAISGNGVAGLHFWPCAMTMNGPRYVELLWDKLKMHSHNHRCMISTVPLPIDRKLLRIFLQKAKLRLWNSRMTAPISTSQRVYERKRWTKLQKSKHQGLKI